MKKIMLLVILFLPLIKVDALTCNYNDIAYLKKLAANISYSYDYVEENNSVSFSIVLTNMQKEFYILDTTTNQKYYYNNSEITISGYTSGEIVKYDFYSNREDCMDQLLYSLSIVLPTYNPYYTNELCTNISNYSLCQKWASVNLTYDQFKSNIEMYLDSLKKDEDDGKSDNNKEENLFLKYLLDYYYVPLIIIIGGCSIGIYIVNKKSNIYG